MDDVGHKEVNIHVHVHLRAFWIKWASNGELFEFLWT